MTDTHEDQWAEARKPETVNHQPHPLIVALRQLRHHHGTTQRALARRIGWSPRTIAGAEAGTSTPTVEFVEDYAAAFGAVLVLVHDSRLVLPGVRRVESRRVCAGCGVSYQVTRHGRIRKHGCMVKEEQ